jgi:hypothetical protein
MADELKEPTAGAGGVEDNRTSAEIRADDIAEAIRKARTHSGRTEKDKVIAEAIDKTETAEMRRALGLDIPFDVRALLIRGVVEKRGMKVASDLFIDMHTLTKAEDILAEKLVEAFHGPMELTKAYLEAKLVATITIAITRINQDLFPVPDPLDPAARSNDEWRTAWEAKRGLFRAFMALPAGDVDALGTVYANLGRMDELIQEEARKKSG